MATPKKYFHDRIILLLLSISAFLTIAGVLIILLRVNADPSATYAVEYRSRQGLDAFKPGSYIGIFSFALFSALVFAFHFYLSRKTYPIKQHFAIAFLALGVLLLSLSIVVSSALLLY